MTEFNAEYWRKRAEQTRILAGYMGDPGARAMVLKLADGYDEMAEIADRDQKTEAVLLKLLEGK